MIEEQNKASQIIENAKKTKAAYAAKHPVMHVKVYSPFKVYFDEEAESISAENGTGPFDILPSHHNFMTLLIPCELIIRTRQREQKIRISGGLMHVKADRLTVFLDI